MFSWKRRPKRLTSERSRYWDAAYIAGGVLVAGLTLRAYRGFSSLSETPAQNRLTPGQAQSTIHSAKSWLNSNPEDFNAWAQLAVAYFNLGPDYYPDAMNALVKARSLGATSESLYYYAGVMYESLGLPDYAINEFSKFLRHYPDDYATQMHLANLFAQQKKYDDAYRLYQSLARRGPNDPTLWFNLAVVSKEKGDLDGALSCFQKLQQLTRPFPEGGLYQEGEIMRLKGSDDQAISLYQQEISLHPQYLPAFIALEAAQRRRGLSKEARETRQKIAALKSKP
jgi:tetratricopeptide (TPR) repeat protein